MSCICYINRIRQNNFTALKTPCVSSIHPPPTPLSPEPLETTNHFTGYIVEPFPERYEIEIKQCVASLTGFFHLGVSRPITHFSSSIAHFFFFFIPGWYSAIWKNHSLSIHLEKDISFQFLTIRNTAALNIYMQVFVWTHLFKSTG